MAGLGIPAGSLIRELRVDAHLNQHAVAELLHISQPQYSRLENGADLLSVEQWVEIAPALALGIYTGDPPPPSELVYVVCWVPAGGLVDAIYPCISGDELPVFGDGRLACRVAAAFDAFGLRGACAYAATRRAVDRDLLQRLTGVQRTHRVPLRDRGAVPDADDAFTFASEAFNRFAKDIRRANRLPSVRHAGATPNPIVWDEDRFAPAPPLRPDDT